MSDFAPLGFDMFGEPIKPKGLGELAKRFEFPPFSVLNAREGNWQDRKRAWLSLGIQSEVGRDNGVTWGTSPEITSPEITSPGLNHYRDEKKAATAVSQRLAPGGGGGGCWIGGPKTESTKNFGRTFGQDLMRGEHQLGMKGNQDTSQSGTSIFDPVLCELVYRWFCPRDGQVVDPFAGGSVRGIVAGMLGLSYWGCDLRPEQIAANEEQRQAIAPGKPISWVVGDALDVVKTAPEADLVFTCPPYGDLERYSDDVRDLSTMEYHTFVAALKRIMLQAYLRLRDHRFACFVVGDFRDKRTGNYRGFVADTIHAAEEIGFGLYNDAVLLTAVGSLPIRITKQFEAGRKLGKTHQNILIFVKGNGTVAADACTGQMRIDL
jgi:DNA modification methylase